MGGAGFLITGYRQIVTRPHPSRNRGVRHSRRGIVSTTTQVVQGMRRATMCDAERLLRSPAHPLNHRTSNTHNAQINRTLTVLPLILPLAS